MAERRFFTDLILGADNMQIAFGTGSPEGVVTADISSLYFRSDAADSTESLYIKDSGSGDTGWSVITFGGGGGGATTLDELTDVDADPAQDGDLLQFIAGSVNEWHATNNIDLSMISTPTGAGANVFPVVVVDRDSRLRPTYKPLESPASYIYMGDPDSTGGGALAIGSGQNGAVFTLTGTNLSGNTFFQELSGGTILWQSFGLSGDLTSPDAIADTPGIIDIYQDSDGEGQAQSYGYFQCSGYDGSSYTNSCVLGAFYDKDGPSLSEVTGGLPGKWIFCTSNGINETFPQPALSVMSDKTVEVVRGTFRIRLGNEMQFWNTDNDSYVSLRAPASPSNGSDNEVNLVLPATTGNDGEVLTTDGTGEMFWAPGGGAVQFEISQAVTLDLLDGVYYDGNDWQPAQANAAETLGTHVVTSASHPFYTLTQAGRITVPSHGLTVGEYYFSDWKTAGTLTATEPPQFSNPLVFVETEHIVHVLPFRPSQINEVSAPFIKGVGVESPTSSEDITMFFTDDAITITQMNAVLRGSTSPSVTWTIRHDTDRSATGNEVVTGGTATTSTTTGSEITSFNDETIPAGSWVWLETTAQSGTVNEINVTIEYTVD